MFAVGTSTVSAVVPAGTVYRPLTSGVSTVPPALTTMPVPRSLEFAVWPTKLVPKLTV